jgi:hypothetical protein
MPDYAIQQINTAQEAHYLPCPRRHSATLTDTKTIIRKTIDPIVPPGKQASHTYSLTAPTPPQISNHTRPSE